MYNFIFVDIITMVSRVAILYIADTDVQSRNTDGSKSIFYLLGISMLLSKGEYVSVFLHIHQLLIYLNIFLPNQLL